MKIKIGGKKKKQWGSSWDKRTNWGVCSWNQGLSKRPRRKLEVVIFRIPMLLDTDQGVREDAWCEQSIRQYSKSHQHWLWQTYRQQRYWHFPDMSPSPWWTHVCAFKWQQEKVYRKKSLQNYLWHLVPRCKCSLGKTNKKLRHLGDSGHRGYVTTRISYLLHPATTKYFSKPEFKNTTQMQLRS